MSKNDTQNATHASQDLHFHPTQPVPNKLHLNTYACSSPSFSSRLFSIHRLVPLVPLLALFPLQTKAYATSSPTAAISPGNAGGAAGGAAPSPNENTTSNGISNPGWRRPPAHCRWEITFRYLPKPLISTSPNLQSNRLLQVIVTQHGREFLQEVQFETGKRTEFWSLADAEIESSADGSSLHLRPFHEPSSPKNTVPPQQMPERKTSPEAPATRSQQMPEGVQEDFQALPEFGWIRPEQYRATIELGGEQVAVFVQADQAVLQMQRTALASAPRSAISGLPLIDGVNAAAISVTTHLPVLLQRGTELRFYKFTPLANEALSRAPKISRFLELLRAPAKAAPRPLP